MNKYFAGVKTVEELRKKYRELLKKYHPDNDGGSVEVTQEINAEYDALFAILSKERKPDGESATYDDKAENEAFKAVINDIKSAGFKIAPKKKCWCWHYGEYRRHHSKEVSLDEIRMKYGSQTVNSKSKQYALN